MFLKKWVLHHYGKGTKVHVLIFKSALVFLKLDIFKMPSLKNDDQLLKKKMHPLPPSVQNTCFSCIPIQNK